MVTLQIYILLERSNQSYGELNRQKKSEVFRQNIPERRRTKHWERGR